MKAKEIGGPGALIKLTDLYEVCSIETSGENAEQMKQGDGEITKLTVRIGTQIVSVDPEKIEVIIGMKWTPLEDDSTDDSRPPHTS